MLRPDQALEPANTTTTKAVALGQLSQASVARRRRLHITKKTFQRAPVRNRRIETWLSPCSCKRRKIRDTEKSRLVDSGSGHYRSNILSRPTFPYPSPVPEAIPEAALEVILEPILEATALPAAALQSLLAATNLSSRRGAVPTTSATVPTTAPVHSLPLLLNDLSL
jgi:hypothetical protein